MRPYLQPIADHTLPRIERRDVILAERGALTDSVRLQEPLRQILMATQEIGTCELPKGNRLPDRSIGIRGLCVGHRRTSRAAHMQIESLLELWPPFHRTMATRLLVPPF
jgi:hypothetical protein